MSMQQGLHTIPKTLWVALGGTDSEGFPIMQVFPTTEVAYQQKAHRRMAKYVINTYRDELPDETTNRDVELFCVARQYPETAFIPIDRMIDIIRRRYDGGSSGDAI